MIAPVFLLRETQHSSIIYPDLFGVLHQPSSDAVWTGPHRMEHQTLTVTAEFVLSATSDCCVCAHACAFNKINLSKEKMNALLGV